MVVLDSEVETNGLVFGLPDHQPIQYILVGMGFGFWNRFLIQTLVGWGFGRSFHTLDDEFAVIGLMHFVDVLRPASR